MAIKLPGEPIMDKVSAKAEKIKKEIFRYCDERCKKSKEGKGSDLLELKAYIRGVIGFVFGAMHERCWGMGDMMRTKCKAKTFMEGKYKSRANDVKNCQKKIDDKKILALYDQIWDKCVAGPAGKKWVVNLTLDTDETN